MHSKAKVHPSLYEFVEMKVDDDSFDRVLQRPRRGSFSSPRLGRKSPHARPFLITSNGSVSYDAGDLFDHLTETSPSPASLRHSLTSSTPSSLRRSSAKKKRVTFRVPLADFLQPDNSEAHSEVEDDHSPSRSQAPGDGHSRRRGDENWSQRMVEKKIKWRRRRYQGWNLVDCCCCLS